MDFMFIPSFSEACPTVIIESLLKGKLCIARDIVGIQEIMNGCSSHFFQNIDELDLEKVAILKSEDILGILKENRERIISRYNPEKIVDAIYNIYKNYV